DDDPDVRALAQSIADFGIKEPLVISTDGYILSGHRRYAAARRAGLMKVPCRVERVCRSDPEFIPLLREYNRQRIKTLDEVAREEALSANPDEAHRVLVEHRTRKAAVSVEGFAIGDVKQRAKISKAKWPMLHAIQAILEELRDYWPLTDRQVHYNLLND